MRNNTISKRKIILAVVVALVAILLFWLLLRFVFDRTEIGDQFGDTGGWGGDGDEIVLTLGDKDYTSEDSVDTYLLMGTDAGGENVDSSHNGTLADFIALIIVDNTTEKFGIIQIDRNTMVGMGELAGYDENDDPVKQQICLAHWYGENEGQRNDNTMQAVSEFLGYLYIQNYYVINMEDIGIVNDALGGVEVTIDTDMTDLDPEFVEGASVVLKDGQAEKFLRARMDVGGGTNKERMSRQTQYMQKAYNKVIDQLSENPDYVNELYDSVHDVVQSEETGSDMSRLANHVMQYENVGILQIDGKTVIGDTQDDSVEHEEFYADSDSIAEVLGQIIDLKEMAE